MDSTGRSPVDHGGFLAQLDFLSQVAAYVMGLRPSVCVSVCLSVCVCVCVNNLKSKTAGRIALRFGGDITYGV